MVTLALVMGIGGLAFLAIVDPAQAEQATSPSASSGKTVPQDQGNMQKRLQSVENELDKLKKEQEIAEDERDTLAAMQATQAGEWETKFDFLRRDPKTRLVTACHWCQTWLTCLTDIPYFSRAQVIFAG